MKKIEFFKNKLKFEKKKKLYRLFVGDLITISYISVDRDMVHQYKFCGICIAVYNKLNMEHIVLRSVVSFGLSVDFCFNLSSPLIYTVDIVTNKDRKKFKKFKKFFLCKSKGALIS